MASFKGWMHKGLFVAAMLSGFPQAQAVVIFSDDFERADNNNLGNDWSEENHTVDDVAILMAGNGYARFRDGRSEGPAMFQTDLDAAGLNAIDLFYSYKAGGNSDNSGSDDELEVLWKLSSDATWQTLATHALVGVGSWTHGSVMLPGTADGNLISIGFQGNNFSHDNLGNLQIDDVSLTGNPATVPEPSILALMGLGLAGIGYRSHRNNKAA